jgi:hypothetical protein
MPTWLRFELNSTPNALVKKKKGWSRGHGVLVSSVTAGLAESDAHARQIIVEG